MEGKIRDINGVETLVINKSVEAVNFLEYEKWLEDLALEGWRLVDIVAINFEEQYIIDWNNYPNEHHFIKDKSRKIKYCLHEVETINGNYKNMFQDFGWELVKKLNYEPTAVTYLWRQEYEDTPPEAFDGIEGLKIRNEKFMKKLKLKAIFVGGVLVWNIPLYFDGNNTDSIWWTLFCAGTLALSIYFDIGKNLRFLKVYKKNKELIENYEKEKAIL